VVDPLGLVLKAGTWYMVARAERGTRTFRLAGIELMETLDERFTRPRKFDLSAYWAESTSRFEAGVYRTEAQLRVSPLGLRRLQGFSPIVAAAATRTCSAPDASGWMRVTIPIESAEDAARDLLKLGAEAEVLQPAQLRELLEDTARRYAALYLGRKRRARGVGS
jgi:predicted DNA-binding transcriptional regulator YafY